MQSEQWLRRLAGPGERASEFAVLVGTMVDNFLSLCDEGFLELAGINFLACDNSFGKKV
jgi:hypothetical protein